MASLSPFCELTMPWNKLTRSLIGVAALLLLPTSIFAQSSKTPDEAADEVAQHFTLKVLPILKAKCFACHGDDPKKIEGELDLTTRENMITGGESWGAALVEKDAEASPLFQAITWEDSDLEMPPKENDRLNARQIAIVRKWINDGAPWPDAETQKRHRRQEWEQVENEDGILVATSGGLADEWTYRRYRPEDVWAFQPVRDAFDHASVDEFISAKLDQNKVAPAPQATPQQLLKRAYFDLIGMPPTPEEAAAFL